MTRIRGQGRNYLHVVTAVVLALAVAAPSLAQEMSPAPKKKAALRPVAHKKASPEQIRKFNELAAKRHREAK